jgi:periplasmic divalent cation tolerance protein
MLINMMLVYTTCVNEKEAQKIAAALLKARLVGCTNWWPIKSSYWWKGKVEKEKEAALILKTQEKNFSKVEKMIKKMHSCSVPCIVGWKIDKVNREYLNWLGSAVK